jgi:2-polyprenyl-3-methyl-5-hydroxy-6-metoxy-1,4-benzoquinol methylase
MITREQQNLFIAKVKEKINIQFDINDYPNVYLSYLLSHLEYFIKIYSVVLNRSLKDANLNIDQASLADLGAGNGMLAIFAKYCGFNKVYINDIDKTFIKSAKYLSSQLSIYPDDFIEGDISDVCHYFNMRNSPDIIVGIDMIEHVYDLEYFIQSLFTLKELKSVIFTTGSNPQNFFKVKQLRKIQYNDEYVGGNPGEYLLYGANETKPFIEIRKEIIRNIYSFPDLLTEKLAQLSRGLIKIDIELAVKKYIETGVFPYKPTDSYNTCNPISGSWSERIIPIKDYRKLFMKPGTRFVIKSGFYNGQEKTIKSLLLKGINILLPLFGLRFAPFIILSSAKNV